MLKKRNLLFPISVLLLILTGCNGSGGENTSSGGTEDSSGRAITVAVPPSAKPLSYTDENGELTGYEVEILKLVDEKLEDYTFDIVGVADSAAEIGLDTGKYDMIAQGLFKSEAREEKYLIPEESNGASLMRVYSNKNNEEIDSFDDLVGKKINPPSPSGGVFNLLTEYNKENPDNPIEFETSDHGFTVADRLKEVESGKYDALVLPSNLGQQEIIKAQNLEITVSEPLKVFPTYFLIHNTEENKAFTEDVSNTLKELKDEGKLSELSLKYYGEDVFQYE
ncbi:transporter substrate-binding domain-containing protein [Psychrobacillus sp. FJAT-51614]|uniref:Transporter substrate-binding domain-containing protein n=1 Tax=Psychrobacillus mangrovi TaxID=3117745 RepID=A0ABU8FA62_9BACI